MIFIFLRSWFINRYILLLQVAFSLYFYFLSITLSAQTDIRIVNFKQLHSVYSKGSDTTFVVNFFASWCVPCVQELPEITAFANNRDDKIKVVFVSLDFAKSYKKDLIPILKKYKITQPVYLLVEPDANSWINCIDSVWSGAIPATLIINNNRKTKKFIEGSVTSKELNNYTKL